MKQKHTLGKIILTALLATLIPLSASAQSNNAPEPMKFSENEVVVVSAKAAPAGPAAKPTTPYVQDAWNVKNGSPETGKMWNLQLYGYIRTGFHWNSVEVTDANDVNTAQNDYFYAAHARLGAKGDFLNKMFGFNILIDGGGKFSSLSKSATPTAVNLKDAYVTYTPLKFVTLQVGKFIPNFDFEGMASTAGRPFAELSVASAKANPGPGNGPAFDISVGRRELGISLGTSQYQPISEGPLAPLGLTYSLTLTNGDNADKALPQGSTFSFYGYFGANWGKLVSVNVGYYATPKYLYGQTSKHSQEKPDLFVAQKELTQGVSTNLTLAYSGLNFTLGYLRRMKKTTTYDEKGEVLGDPQEEPAAQGMLAFLQYTYAPLGLTPGIRYAFQDPNVDLEGDKSQIKHEITFGLNWQMASLPIKAVANYGIHLQKGFSVGSTDVVMKPTHNIDLVLQAQW